MAATIIALNLQRQQSLNYRFARQVKTSWIGRLPAGLSLTSDGLGVTGQVSDSSGYYDALFPYYSDDVNAEELQITVVDSNLLSVPVLSCDGAISINGVMTLTVEPGSFYAQMRATNAGGNWTGSFPGGVGMNSFGLISGTLSPGSYTIVVQASNNAWWLNSYTYGPTQTGTYYLHLVVPLAIPVLTVSSQYGWFGGNFTVGDDMPSYTIFSVQDNARPVTWSATGLPDGVIINPTTGYITGKMNIPGSFNAVITATNSSGSGHYEQQINVAENHNPPVVTLAAEQPGATNPSSYGNSSLSFAVGSPVTIYLDATNTPTSWAAADLPSGLSIDAITGVVSGVLRAPGSYRFFVTAANTVCASAPLPVTVAATGVAQAFRFVSDDPTLTDLQIDVRTGVIASSQPLAFKQLEEVRLALVFLDFGQPIAPPAADSVTIGMRPDGMYEEDYLFDPPAVSLVAAAAGNPAYLLAEFTVTGDEIDSRLADIIAQAAITPSMSALFTAMAEVAWLQNAIPRISDTFKVTFEPAVTDTNN